MLQGGITDAASPCSTYTPEEEIHEIASITPSVDERRTSCGGINRLTLRIDDIYAIKMIISATRCYIIRRTVSSRCSDSSAAKKVPPLGNR